MPKYSDAVLLNAAGKATSIFDILRILGVRLTGGSHQHIKRRLASLGFDVKALAYKGTRSNQGRTFSTARRTIESILIKRELGGRRQHAHLLRRGLLESGVLHECSVCHVGPVWYGNTLVFDIDHKNNDWLDDRLENLQFLCPNCHSVK